MPPNFTSCLFFYLVTSPACVGWQLITAPGKKYIKSMLHTLGTLVE